MYKHISKIVFIIIFNFITPSYNGLIAQDFYAIKNKFGKEFLLKTEKTKLILTLSNNPNKKVKGFFSGTRGNLIVLNDGTIIPIENIQTLSFRPHKKSTRYIIGTYCFLLSSAVAYSFYYKLVDGGSVDGAIILIASSPVLFVLPSVLYYNSFGKGAKVKFNQNDGSIYLYKK